MHDSWRQRYVAAGPAKTIRLVVGDEMNIHRVYRLVSTPFRRRRMRAFERRFALDSSTTILDVGGTPETWELAETKPHVTLLNLTLPRRPLPHHVKSIVGDGTCLPFADKAYDIVFSNSVIEHLHTRERQSLFASEVRRVGRRYYVQTPNRWFPVEPHYLTPGMHFLPKSWQRKLLRNFSVWGWITRPTRQDCERSTDEIRLLSAGEFQSLFPDSSMTKERFVGFTKSLTVERR